MNAKLDTHTHHDAIRNPLQGLPSVLAIRDLRTRILQSLAKGSPARAEEKLLGLDPLAVMRCMRMAHAPIYDARPQLHSLPELCKVLGLAKVRRALGTEASDVAGTTPVRRLWLHAIATAHAARSLAESSGECDPDHAYVLGLLHDLPLWLHYLSLRRSGGAPSIGALTWIRHWHLPDELANVVEATMMTSAATCTPSATTSVVTAAELLAELADFWHPDDGDVLSRNLLLSVVTKDDLVAAHNLRQQVAHSIGEFGLDGAGVEPEQLEATPYGDTELFPSRNEGNVADLVLSLMSCSDSTHYKGVITATTAACLRYLRFERAYSVRYSPEGGSCRVRAKADLSPRRLTPIAVEPTEQERILMERAQRTGEVQLLVNEGLSGQGLLRLLGTDDALLAPLNRDFRTPTFLVLDRALSGTPIRLARDRIGAKALAGTASILTENLLLKKQRERAHKFALTDPLTRMFNRGVGIARLGQEISRARRTGAPLTVLMLDLDDFKKLNDSRGHLVGDQALRSTADVLRKTLRRTDTVCRYGGEEFLIVLPETSLEEASVSATRIFIAVEEAGVQMDLPLTISIGLAAVRTDRDDVESVLSRADRALYASKSRGRNRFSVDEE